VLGEILGEILRSNLIARFLARLLIIPAFLGTLAFPTQAEALRANRVTAFKENIASGSVGFSLAGQGRLAAPRLHYLPGINGETLLVADFYDVYFPYPYQIVPASQFQSSKSASGIGVIHFGQFQNRPAIFRIAISALNPTVLKTISFQAADSHLTLSWKIDRTYNRQTGNKQTEPAIARTQEIEKRSLRVKAIETAYKQTGKDDLPEGPLDPDQMFPEAKPQSVSRPTEKPQQEPLRLVFDTRQFDISEQQSGQIKEDSMARYAKAPVPSLPIDAPNIEIESAADAQAADNNSQIFQPGASPVKVSITNTRKLSFSCLRLHEPERYVIDFQDLAQIATVKLPPPPEGSPFKAMRLGAPEEKPNISRLVFDLTSGNWCVHPQLSNLSTKLVLTFDKSASMPTTQSLPRGLQVILDPGHGGSDPGAQRAGIQEKQITLAIGAILKQLLEQKGVNVILTRSDDTFVSLEERARLTNAVNPNLFLSIHINSLDTDSDIHGIETYYQTNQSRLLAQSIHDSLVNRLEVPDRYVRKARFYVINHTPVPAVLAEVGFISCQTERENLMSVDYQNRIAKALEQGVILYLVRQSELAQLGRTAVNRTSSSQQLDGKASVY
jgi:N-acetylmuramoyl-L-alanine amidase